MLKNWSIKSEFAKNVITLISGTAIAQALSLIFSPVISRIYNPEDFGFFAIFMSIVSGIAVIACGRFELTILLPEKEEDAQKNKSIALLFCISISSITTIVMSILFALNIVQSVYYLLTGVLVFIFGIYQINTNSALRSKNYKVIAKSRVINSVINVILSISFGLFKYLHVGMILSTLIGQTMANSLFKYPFLNQKINKSYLLSLKPTIIKYKHFLQFNTVQALSDMFMINAMYYLLPFFYSSSLMGLYALAIRILQAPMSLIGSSLAQVFYQQATQYYKDNKPLNGLIKSTLYKAAIVALPIPVILILFGPSLFALVFGERWEAAGNLARILSPWIYFDFIRSTISQIPLILNKQKELFRYSIAGNFILVLIILLLGFYNQTIEVNFFVITITMCIYSLFLIKWIYQLTKQTP
jgi:O-antigen/teichoic acid export membrane protein